MDKNEFLISLRNLPGWKAMLENGRAGFVYEYNGVTFNIFRDDANHFLNYKPSNDREKAIIAEFNALMESCRAEISAELDQAATDRLNRDDNQADPIG